MTSGSEDQTVEGDLARQMILASRESTRAISQLSVTLEDRHQRTLDKLAVLEGQHVKLESILLGEHGDNGLTSRVMLLEKSKGHVSWAGVAVIVGLALSALALLLRGA